MWTSELRHIFKGGAEGQLIGSLKTSRDFEGNHQILVAEVEEAILKQCTTVGVTGQLEKRKGKQEIKRMWKELFDCARKYSVDCHQLAIMNQSLHHEDSRIDDVKIFVDGQDCGFFWHPDSTKLTSLANQAPFGRDTETVSCNTSRVVSIMWYACVYVCIVGRSTRSVITLSLILITMFSTYTHARAHTHTSRTVSFSACQS